MVHVGNYNNHDAVRWYKFGGFIQVVTISVVSSPGTLSPFATLDIQPPPSFHG